MSRPVAPTVANLIEHLGKSEPLLAVLTAEVHRFYYDECFNPYDERPYKTEDVKFISDLYNVLWLSAPAWRDAIQKMIKRYMVSGANVKTLPIFYQDLPKAIEDL